MISQEELKELFDYNPRTGLFTRIKLNPHAHGVKLGLVSNNPTYYGYLRIKIKGETYFIHRLAWLYVYGVWPKEQIDHINHDRSDNRWVNLREATLQENGKNRTLNKNNKSGVCGVCWDKSRNKWYSYIKINMKIKHLGHHIDKFEAICARKSEENRNNFHSNHGLASANAVTGMDKMPRKWDLVMQRVRAGR